MHKFEEPELVRRLSRLSPLARIAFAAACAERLFPSYMRYIARSGFDDGGVLRRALETAWSVAAGIPQPRGVELADMIESAMDLIPNPEGAPGLPELPVAEDFGAAVVYTLRCVENGDPQEAAWAARCAYEAMDNVVLRRTGIDVNAPGAERRILADPLIQAELGYQEEDLSTLERFTGAESPPDVELMRRWAVQRAHALF